MMYYPDVPALEPDELELLCHEYLEHNATLDPHLADQMGVKRGLRNADGTGVLDACTASGFANYSSFLKSFRALYGITPAEYRAQLRQSRRTP